jgi:uncharacterized protein YndB with AHSA1/START domain
MKYTYSIEINAPPARVFPWINDGERLKQWIPNLVENEQLEVSAGTVGSTFRQVYLERGRRMEMHGKVTRFEQNRRLTAEIGGDLFDLLVDYRLEDIGGCTRLTQDSTITFKNAVMRLVTKLMGPFMRKATAQQAEAGFGKLKRLAESA